MFQNFRVSAVTLGENVLLPLSQRSLAFGAGKCCLDWNSVLTLIQLCDLEKVS